jgi:hypothetical protein
MTTAVEKIRQTITGSPVGELHFQHQGDQVVRWLTGGTLPDAWVTFQREGDQTIVRCAGCQSILATLSASWEQVTAEQLAEIRSAGHENHKPEDWPNHSSGKE